jgi:hypothetical protein
MENNASYDQKREAVEENAPPVRLLALGRDSYWPVANLGPYNGESPTRLPVVGSQIARELDPLDLPASWRAVQLVSAGLALTFCLVLWLSSVFSHSPTLAKFAPACPDSRTNVILISGSAFTLIILILLWPSFQYVKRETPDYLLLLAGLLVIGMTTLELITRTRLLSVAPVEPAASIQPEASLWARWRNSKLWILVAIFALFLYLALRSEPTDESRALLWRFVTLRATHLTSGLSFIMPIFFFLGAWLWWSASVVGGYTLLDPRRSQLPRNMADPGLAALGDRVPKDLQRVLQPRLLDRGKDLLLLVAIAVPLLILVGWRHWNHLCLEQPVLGRLIVASLALAVTGVIESTQRLWKIWVEVRRLLDALDSQPLRRGFVQIKGFSWKPIWRLGAGTMAEFQRLLARQREALTCAMNSFAGLQARRKDLDTEWNKTLTEVGPARTYDHALVRSWYKKQESQLRLILQFGKYQEEVSKAAAIALDYLAERWAREKEEENRPADNIDLEVRACERFVCFVYVNCLLTLLTRIRTLIVAIGGMYVLILIGTTQYPFEPKDGVQLLLVALLAGVIAVVGLVFAQIHRDATLSHITDTYPGELGSDFWIRMGSFVALPLFTLFTSQFPSVNRLFYSWIRPAIESLNH